MSDLSGEVVAFINSFPDPNPEEYQLRDRARSFGRAVGETLKNQSRMITDLEARALDLLNQGIEDGKITDEDGFCIRNFLTLVNLKLLIDGELPFELCQQLYLTGLNDLLITALAFQIHFGNYAHGLVRASYIPDTNEGVSDDE